MNQEEQLKLLFRRADAHLPGDPLSWPETMARAHRTRRLRITMFVTGFGVAVLAVVGTVSTGLLTGREGKVPMAPANPGGTGSPSPSPSDGSETNGLSETDPLRVDGIGGIAMGMTVKEAEAAAGLRIRVPSDFGKGCQIAEVIGGPPDLSLMLSDGVVVRIDVFGRSSVRTVAGVGVGKMDDDVFRLYGAAVTEEPHPYLYDRGSYLVYTPEAAGGHLLIFETKAGQVTSFRSGYEEQVRYKEGCA